MSPWLPGFSERAFGVAIDVGSTTIAAHLCDLTTGEVVASVGAMNPQIRFGEDLMSRVSYVMMNPGGDEELTRSVREAMDALIGEAAREAGAERSEIFEITLVGNPIMHHLVLGLDPTELGGAPFALTIDGAYDVRARELGLNVAPGAFLYALPCIAGHVGADAAGVVLAEAPYLRDELTLLVDVGTNAEIVFGNRERLLACSSPTGPAFEGAQISCGQRAAPGAIERVRIDRETLEPRFKVIGSDLWSDEPGFAEATASLGVTGVCGSGIIEAIAEMYLAGILSQDGVIDGALAERSARIEATGRTFAYVLNEGAPRLLIYQTDVRAIQLAKAALYAGAKLLIERRGGEAPQRITLAGAFGSHIDPTYAMVARPHPRLRSRQGRERRQCGGHGRAHRAARTLPRAPRSRASSAISRRSRPRSSRTSRACSSRRWRSPTRTIRFPISLRRFRCLPRRRRAKAAAEGGDAPGEEISADGRRAHPRRRPCRRNGAARRADQLGKPAAQHDAHRPRADARSHGPAGPAGQGVPRRPCRRNEGKGLRLGAGRSGAGPCGLKVGRYGSPHVVRINERVTLDGHDVDDATLARALSRALDAYEDARREQTDAADATWFDLLTSAAFLIFRDAGVEWAAVEVGLGGRLDSTNVVDGEVAVITNVELEHTEVLGKTREAIAREKAGILKPGATVVTTLEADDEAGRVVRAIAEERGCRVVRVRRFRRRYDTGDQCVACGAGLCRR